MSPEEQEQVVKAALFPDPNKAIDATLGHLHPFADMDEEGFKCIAYLADIEEPEKSIVRKVLSAGAALELVRPDDQVDEAHQVHSDFYKLLARIRLKTTE